MKNKELENMVTDLYEKDIPVEAIRDLYEKEIPEGTMDDLFFEDEELPEYEVVGEDVTENLVFQNQLRDELNAALNDLTELERNVLIYRFGLNGNDTYTRPEIAKMLDTTIDRVRNAEDRGIRKLKHPRYTKGLREYLDLDTGTKKR